jgi:hypothetical protein
MFLAGRWVRRAWSLEQGLFWEPVELSSVQDDDDDDDDDDNNNNNKLRKMLIRKD